MCLVDQDSWLSERFFNFTVKDLLHKGEKSNGIWRLFKNTTLEVTETAQDSEQWVDLTGKRKWEGRRVGSQKGRWELYILFQAKLTFRWAQVAAGCDVSGVDKGVIVPEPTIMLLQHSTEQHASHITIVLAMQDALK